MREILSILHDRHAVQGVTVFRGVAGFGAGGEVHADDMLRLNVDLPLVIEFFDEPVIAEGGHPPARRFGSRRTRRIVAGQTLWRCRSVCELS